MAGENDKLRETLEQLQAQLGRMRDANPAMADQLARTLAEARALLEGRSAQPARPHSIVQSLSDAVLKYEASHPDLAINLGSIINALGQMGI